MHKGRLEAFSDGVIAIIITIMVLELKVPHTNEIKDLFPLIPVFMSYVLSFIYVGIYWNNHHHTFQSVKSISGPALWANLHLLFWLSLIPFVSGWMGENHFSQWPAALYGFVMLMNSIAYYILIHVLTRNGSNNIVLKEAIGSDRKGKLSTLIYVIAIGMTWLNSGISFCLYVLVAVIWFIPDTRIEKAISAVD